MEYIIGIIILIITWLVWSRKAGNKHIKSLLTDVSLEMKQTSIVPMQEIIRYCSENKIKYKAKHSKLMITYNNKNIYVQNDSQKVGGIVFSVKK